MRLSSMVCRFSRRIVERAAACLNLELTAEAAAEVPAVPRQRRVWPICLLAPGALELVAKRARNRRIQAGPWCRSAHQPASVDDRA